MKFAGRNRLRGAVTAALLGAFAVAAPLSTYAQEFDEIVVKARKKDESIQEVPLAVTAVTADMVEQMNLQDLDDIAKITAGMTFDPEFSRTSNRPVIRGQANILGDSGVAYFIDGVYITGSINDYDINDIERIEIVKGPQSAMYGRNTYSGAINIITKSPGDAWAARGQVKLSDDSAQEYSATIKGPLGDSAGIGITARHYSTDGFWTNAYDGSDIGLQESTSMSAVLTLDPSDRFSARARVYYNETRDGQGALFAQPASENNCFSDTGSSLYGGLGRYYCGTIAPRPVNTDWRRQVPNARDDNDTLQVSLAMDFHLTDNVTLTSITGYNKVDAAFVLDGDYDDYSFAVANFTPNGFPYAGFPAPPFDYGYVGDMVDFTFAGEDEISDFSQEFRLSWSGENSEYLIGAYFFDQDTDSRDVRELPANAQTDADANWLAEFLRMQGVCASNPFCGSMAPFFGSTLSTPRNVSLSNIENSAFFAMAEFALSDATSLRIEGRYAKEELSRQSIVQNLEDATPTLDVTSSPSFSSFNPRLTLSHQLDDNHMVYAVYAQGNKPGGINSANAVLLEQQTGQNIGSYGEEEVVSIEIGSKNTAFDGQLVANVSLYFNEIEGYQLTKNVQVGATSTSAVTNAGDAEIFGAEIEFRYMPAAIEGLSFMMNYTLTDADFVNGTDENWGLLLDVEDNGEGDCSVLGDEFNPGFVYGVDDCDRPAYGPINGKKIPRVAEHQFFFDAELRRPMSGDWDWYAGANYSHESSKFGQVANFAETGEADIVNARLGFSNSRYNISLWGKNLTGEDSTPLVLRYADGGDSFKRNFVGTLRRDTYWGLTASARFD